VTPLTDTIVFNGAMVVSFFFVFLFPALFYWYYDGKIPYADN
jgi:hypothetical protein